jgi:hypothetical protein
VEIVTDLLDKIQDISVLRLQEGETLVVRVPVGDMSRDGFREYCSNVLSTLSTYLLTNRIVVMPSSISLDIVSTAQLKDIENVNS